ncbi:hypothetical protein [Photobacterium sp. 1_MG-2023]|uniref:hypothetical protein n=1 Tax=Photobacterium sp. 1_MG-2023 TaxID=3062646 RepID=UPI0026E41612|nr:hypothetical protein [Photobacterium sp. 1_MG-2023]MDO6709035.1 hypothetical protein [Photobacterium sp. 1_MG-2023]
MKITGFDVFGEDGEILNADSHGNNVAFNCFVCGHPVLAVCLVNQRGSDDEHPAHCKGAQCNAAYVLDVRERMKKLYIFKINSGA